MTPQRKGHIPAPQLRRLKAALAGKDAGDREVRAAVVAALSAGGSVREVADVTGLSTRTVQTWGHDGGWPTPDQKAAMAETRRKNAEWAAFIAVQETLPDEP